MRYEGVMLIVKDARSARLFYEEVLQSKVTLDLGKHVVFEGGFFLLQEDDWLAFSRQRPKELHYRSNTVELVFETDDLPAFLAHLQKHPEIRLLHNALEHPWGRTAVRFYDPDGHLIEVGESMTLVVKRFLQQGLSVEEAASRSEFPKEFVLQCQKELNHKK